MTPTFAELGVPADLASVLAERGITSPFPIQAATLPDGIAGRDLCGRAPTGSGKTLAFGIAVAAGLPARKGSPRRPEALVLVPTRELCAQVADELAPLARARGRRVVAVYGGVSDRPQRRDLARGATIVVACPGRLEDLVDQRALELGEVRHVVIDEADRMADMGFLPAVRRILDRTHPQRQTQLFSATLGGPVATLTRHYQRDPARHEIEATDPSVRLEDHQFHSVARADRAAVTARLVAEHGSTVVFCRTRHGASRLARQLDRLGVSAAEIHGGRSQGQRDRSLGAFAAGRVSALVATDVAARGIHVDGVACVIHFDLPADADTYIHRSGRTGRAGSTGVVVALVDETATDVADDLRRALDRVRPDARPGRAEPTAGKAAPASRRAARRGTEATRTRRKGRAHDGPAAGRIVRLHTRAGYGFIARDGADDLFVHHTNLHRGEWRRLAVGDRVEFRVGPGRKGHQALEVCVL